MPNQVTKEIAKICHNRAQVIMRSVFSLILYSIVLSYILKMESDCECSNGKMRDILKYGAMMFIGVAVLGFIPGMCDTMNNNMLFVSVIGFTKLAYMITLIIYIWKLKRSQCKKCSDDWRRLGLEVYIYILFALLGVAMLYPFVVLLMYNLCRKN